MKHEARSFDHLLGKLEGIGDKQLTAHFGLYKGYVNKLNEMHEKLAAIDPKGGNYSFNEFSEIKRREAVAYNGTFLHELYFDNLAAPGQTPPAGLKAAVEKSFGSWDKYVADLRGSATSTHGWVVTCFDKNTKGLHNYIMFEHHIGLPVHQEIVLALDCWEHAYMIDFGTAKAQYLDAFTKNVNWKLVDERLTRAAR